MEIIKKGVKPADREYTHTCNCCETVFKFKQSECSVEYDQREYQQYIRVSCPLCYNVCYINI